MPVCCSRCLSNTHNGYVVASLVTMLVVVVVYMPWMLQFKMLWQWWSWSWKSCLFLDSSWRVYAMSPEESQAHIDRWNSSCSPSQAISRVATPQKQVAISILSLELLRQEIQFNPSVDLCSAMSNRIIPIMRWLESSVMTQVTLGTTDDVDLIGLYLGTYEVVCLL